MPILPLKSVVGVNVKAPVPLTLGPTVHVAEDVPVNCPVKASTNVTSYRPAPDPAGDGAGSLHSKAFIWGSNYLLLLPGMLYESGLVLPVVCVNPSAVELRVQLGSSSIRWMMSILIT